MLRYPGLGQLLRDTGIMVGRTIDRFPSSVCHDPETMGKEATYVLKGYIRHAVVGEMSRFGQTV